MNTKFSVVLAALGFALASVAAQAAGSATQSQLKGVPAGQTETEVIQSLGEPMFSLTWDDGTHSLVYGVSDSEDVQLRGFARVGPDGKVLEVQFANDRM